jgi:hypothetical protein
MVLFYFLVDPVAQLVDELHNKPEFARSIAHRIIEIFH